MILLVVDVQKGITDERLYEFHQFEENIIKLIDHARNQNIEVIYVQHDDGPGTGFSVGDEEFEIYDKIAPLDHEKIFYKTINSCFGNKDFADYMESQTDKIIIVIGLQTNFCIDATIKSAFEKGYRVIVPLHANSTFDNDYMDSETTYKYYNEMMWPRRFAECISVEQTMEIMKNNVS